MLDLVIVPPLRLTRIDTPVGPLTLAADADVLVAVSFASPDDEPVNSQPSQILERVGEQLAEYFEGRRRSFEVPFRLEGTPFQREVWTALLDVPFGVTVSYAAIARRIGRPDAMRAVGAANGANPIAIIVPCHRVVGADGSLVGYGGGLPAKAALLRLEGAPLASLDQLSLDLG